MADNRFDSVRFWPKADLACVPHMSAIGPKRTSASAAHMSAFGG
jgi:hypothetical protein